MTNDKIMGINMTMLIAVINLLSIIAIVTYVVRTTSDINAYLDELSRELRALKTSYSDNSKRVHSAISKLNQREEIRKQEKQEPKIQELEDDEINSRVDEVSAAIDEL